ncbi:MAG TPA: STT3 domain-containing protein [Candidatus Bilamarchaeum sp.]|nr:STT3 domain-containing protein [Candidatus Bilamarchaeum sp.]
MFVSFNPLILLVWIFLSGLLPGAILSLGLFRKDEFTLLEKILIGFGLGTILLPLLPFVLFLFLGVEFSFPVAVLSVAFIYAVSIAVFVRNKAYEGISISLKADSSMLVPAFLLIVLLLSFMARFGSYSPVFQELDPYYYTYTAHQILTVGGNPMDDRTAWYPDVTVNHRVIPEISYLESIWYSLYTGGGGDFSNLLLADVASLYPPLAALLSVFFIYLLVSTCSKKEYGVIAAALASFVPIFVYKLAAGEHEVQPYAFFALAFFYAMYALMLKKRDIRFAALAGLGFAALALGSSSQILAVISVVLFIVMESILHFLRDDEPTELKRILVTNSVLALIGPLLGSAILRDVFENGSPSFSIIAPFVIAIAFAGALYAIKLKISDKNKATLALGALLLAGLLVYSLTPVGGYIKNIAQAGFGFAQYNKPLDRTIAEQGLAAPSYDGTIGFISTSFSLPPQLDSLGSLISILMFMILLPFTVVTNALLSVFVAIVNVFISTSVEFAAKDVSLLLLWLFIFWAVAAISIWRFAKKEDDLIGLLLLVIVTPPLVVGLIKAKYTIYAGVLLAIALGFTLGYLDSIVPRFVKDAKVRENLLKGLLYFGIIIALLQFSYMGFAPSLAWGSLQTLYQNDPQALAAKFSSFCASSNDTEACAAAADPVGYASQGTNFQYNYKLCLLSVFSQYSYLQNPAAAPPWESQSAYFRCQRISEYWVDSMEWLKGNTEPGSRITSWWDYGHWINYFGDRNAVIRNEHMSPDMIGEVAHGYVDATPAELKSWMVAHDSKYALFDVELLSSGNSLGGKYGALNYLSCAYHNLTTVAQSPGDSQCEADHLWETVVVSQNPCTISNLTGRTGFVAYKVYSGNIPLVNYPDFCIQPTDPNVVAYCRDALRAVPAYCAGEVSLASGEKTLGTYYLNETNPNGDLKVNKAVLQLPRSLPATYHFGPAVEATLFYTKDQVWLDNGQVVSGYSDRKGLFYDSALYQAFFLRELPGFTLVYESPNGGAVKIYKLAE